MSEPGSTAPRSLVSELRRTNFHGRTVSLAEGIGVCAGTVVIAAVRGRPVDAVVLAGVSALGLVDDLVEHRQRLAGRAVSKGLRGHLRSLRAGRLTTGGAKAIGIPALALVGSLLAPGPARRRVLPEAVMAAGLANLANLLDLRPGRALKSILPPALVLAALPSSPRRSDAARAATGRDLALAAALPGLLALPVDLAEIGMLGDAGANTLGAAVGGAIGRRAPWPVLIPALGVVIGLTLLSERVSFSAVIARHRVLSALDLLGRRPAPRRDGAA